METVWRVLTRKKVLDPVSTQQSELGRVLNTVDLTALGVGSTLGVGVYVLVGHVAKDIAGPAVILSFVIATVASVFAGLCYAEFGARAPRAGSAYVYSYVCVGEFVAFVIGWNLILEYVIGSASVARGLSLYLDTLINNTLKDTFIHIAPISNVSFMSSYFDFFAFGVSIMLSLALAFGLKESSWANNIFTLVNLVVVVFVIIAGGIKADGHNWNIDARNITGAGSGGFFPFGVEGVIKGAATCFYGFVGFDCIATTGEEVKNPKRAIPLAIIVSLSIIFLAYFGTSTVVTLMVPYFEQDPDAPLPHAFESVGMSWAKWVVAIGGIFGLCASLFGAMFPLPRIIYAMASDSIIFQFLGRVSSRFKTPVVGTLLAGLLTGLMAALFELKQLVNMMSIGTLMAYTIVAASVLLLRYEVEKGEPLLRSLSDSEDSPKYSDTESLENERTTDEAELVPGEITSENILRQIFNCGRQQSPSEVSQRLVKVEVFLYCILCILIGVCIMFLNEPIRKGEIWAIVLTAVIVALAILVVMSITTQPKSRKELSFKVPLVPLIPALSILVNIYLMLMLDANTWIRFAVWMLLGIPTYYFSVKTHPDARNESIYSRDHPITANGKLNGLANPNFLSEEEIENEQRKRPAPLPPILKNIEATIADLDQMLENEEANINNDRKYSADSLSTASDVLREENVQADVHCSDVPPTPTIIDDPLLQSSGLVYTKTNTYPSDIFDLSSETSINVKEPTNSNAEGSLIATEPEETNNPEDEPVRNIDKPNEKQAETVANPDEPEVIVTLSQQNDVVDRDEFVSHDIPTVPLPPPLMEIQTVDIPRPHFHADTFNDVKLKPVQERKPPSIPPVDYSRENSTIPATDGNIKFGTVEYKEFLEQLGQQLQQNYVPPQVVIEPTKKTVVPRVDVHVASEDIIEDGIDRNVAKEKLTQFLERTNSLPYFPGRNNKSSELNDWSEKETKQINLSEDKEKHRQNMESIFKSVRLRKDDSFKQPETKGIENGVLKSKDPGETFLTSAPHDKIENNDRVRHQENMDSIFKSIRLRKVDNRKTNESQ